MARLFRVCNRFRSKNCSPLNVYHHSQYYAQMKSMRPEQIVVSEFDSKQLGFDNEEEAEAFNPLYEYIDVYRPILLKTDEYYRECAKIITQHAEKNDRSWIGIKMTPICIEQFENKTLPQTKQNLAKVDDGVCKFLYQVKLYTDSLYLKCVNLNAALNSKDEAIKELKIIVGRKVEKIKELQEILDTVHNTNDSLLETQKNLENLLTAESTRNKEINAELAKIKKMHDDQAMKFIALQIKIAELKQENSHFIERFGFTEEEKQRLLNKMEHNEDEVKLLTDEIHKLKQQNTETSINLSNKSNKVEQQEQNIKVKDKLLIEKDELIKHWRQRFHAADKSLTRWKVMFICAAIMLIAEMVILYDHIQSMTMMKVWNRCKSVGTEIRSWVPL